MGPGMGNLLIRRGLHTGLQEVIAEETAGSRGDVGCVLCLGHNKGMEEAASALAACFFSLGPCRAACHALQTLTLSF